MLTTAAINLGLVTVLFFVLGMIKPGWPLFFMEKPNRFIILMVTTVLIMVSFTMFGEGARRGNKPNEWTKLPTAGAAKPAETTATVAPIAPVPVPEVKDDLPPASPSANTTPAVNAVPTLAPVPAPSITAPAAAITAPAPVAPEGPVKK